MVIEPLSIRLIKPNFTVGIIFLIHLHHFIRDRLTSVISEQFEVTMLLIQNIRWREREKKTHRIVYATPDYLFSVVTKYIY